MWGLGVVLAFFLVSCLFISCGKSEEEILLETIEEIGRYAENRDIDGVLRHISPVYSDDEGHSFEDIQEMMNEYFDKYRGIVVNLLATKIIKLEFPNAEIQTEVALSSGAAKLFRKAVRYSGRFYRFKVKLVKEKEMWKCTSASWEQIDLKDLLPESLKIIKELFPQIEE